MKTSGTAALANENQSWRTSSLAEPNKAIASVLHSPQATTAAAKDVITSSLQRIGTLCNRSLSLFQRIRTQGYHSVITDHTIIKRGGSEQTSNQRDANKPLFESPFTCHSSLV